MKNITSRAFGSRLSFIQARNCVIVAFLVGMVLSVIQITVDYARETDAVENFANEVLEASKFAAADAAFHLDGPAAQEVVKGVLQYHSIVSATISNEKDFVLADLHKKLLTDSAENDAYYVFGKNKTFTAKLQLETGELLGRLEIEVDPALAAQGFIDRSVLVVVSGLVRNILLAVALIFVFHHTITKKLVSISDRLTHVDIKNPQRRIPESSFKKAGELRDLVHTINRMLDTIASDIEVRELREQALLINKAALAHQADHDALTGLINRRGFEKRMTNALESSQRNHAEHVLCYLDLDQFKVINDTCGHIAGDELLRELGGVLAGGIRRHDVLARLGGDEFGILMEHCDLEHASKIAESLCRLVDEYRFDWEGRKFSLGVSIGVVAITFKETEATELLKKADVACYAAKAAGRHCMRLYQEDDVEFSRLHGAMSWVQKINQALEEDRFKLFAQTIEPVIKTVSHGLHYEVLLRMVSEENVLVAPGAFLPAAEEYGLITKVDSWVINTLFNYLSINRQHLQDLWLCSVNLSGASITQPGFQNFILDSLERLNIPPEKICFEVTETAAISNLALATQVIDVLRGAGCSFALDDFGTGLSSFGYLKSLKVDFLKIDGVFIRNIVNDPIDYATTKSINEVGHVTGMKTIAEFVEDDEIREKLAEIGVDFAQGYGISVPRPIEDVVGNYERSGLNR